jgi:iron complex transport system ATP-binding protein
VIRVEDVEVRRGGRTVLASTTMRVERGDWLCLIGPNGAGKSTLLATIAGLVPFAGTIEIDGRPLHAFGRRERARTVALVPQLPVVPDGLRVADYVLLGRAPYFGAFGAESRRDVDVVRDVLDRLDLGWAGGRRLHALSGGELQRVILARALAQEAPILLLDEPTTGLDLAHQHRVLEHVAALREAGSLTVVTAMHDLTIAGQFAPRFAMLAGGRVVADGPRAEVLRPDVIERHYGVSVRVLDDPDGGTIVVPVRSASFATAPGERS